MADNTVKSLAARVERIEQVISKNLGIEDVVRGPLDEVTGEQDYEALKVELRELPIERLKARLGGGRNPEDFKTQEQLVQVICADEMGYETPPVVEAGT